LNVDAVVGVGASVDDVHHRHGQRQVAGPAQVPVQRQAIVARGRVRRRQRHGQNGIGAQVGFEIRAVRLEHPVIEPALILGVEADQKIAQRSVDVCDRFEHALAAVSFGVPVAQFHSFARSGGSAGRNRRPADHSGMQQHVRLDGGIAARIDDFAAADIDDTTHRKSPCRILRH
jgi:hypothetical protein